MASTWRSNLKPVHSPALLRTLPKTLDSQRNQLPKNVLRENLKLNSQSLRNTKRDLNSSRDTKENLNFPRDAGKGLISSEDTKKSLNSPRDTRKGLIFPGDTKNSLNSPRNIKKSLNSPRDTRKGLISPVDTKKSPSSRWNFLASNHPRTTTPRKGTPEKKTNGHSLITADELLARKFSPEKKPDPRQRSHIFLKAVEMFEGEIPEKLLKQEGVIQDVADEKLNFCSNEMIDMRKFIEQIEQDFLSIRDLIDKVKENIVGLKRDDGSFV